MLPWAASSPPFLMVANIASESPLANEDLSVSKPRINRSGCNVSAVTVTAVLALSLLVVLLQSRKNWKLPSVESVTVLLPDGREIELPAHPPAPPVAVQLSALATDQDRVLESPSSIEEGLAPKELITTSFGGLTVTVV